MIADCQARYETVSDYVCTFSKRERIEGRLRSKHVMLMKVRTHPRSIYLKFRQPSPGREAIYVEGRNDGKLLAHEVGLKRLIAGTLSLDPTGSMAMEDNRHTRSPTQGIRLPARPPSRADGRTTSIRPNRWSPSATTSSSARAPAP